MVCIGGDHCEWMLAAPVRAWTCTCIHVRISCTHTAQSTTQVSTHLFVHVFFWFRTRKLSDRSFPYFRSRRVCKWNQVPPQGWAPRRCVCKLRQGCFSRSILSNSAQRRGLCLCGRCSVSEVYMHFLPTVRKQIQTIQAAYEPSYKPLRKHIQTVQTAYKPSYKPLGKHIQTIQTVRNRNLEKEPFSEDHGLYGLYMFSQRFV